MRVFISWSGSNDRSHVVARALHEYLPMILQDVEPWLSSESQEAGARWSVNIAAELDQSDFGVVCVTPTSFALPWLNFEAGALSKRVDRSLVVPFVIDMEVRELVGPLLQFQAVRANEAGTLQLLKTMNNNLKRRLSESQLMTVFGKLWPDFSRAMEQPVGLDMPTKKRAESEILEEILEIVRDLPRTSATSEVVQAELFRLLGRPRSFRLHISEDPGPKDEASKGRGDHPMSPAEKPNPPSEGPVLPDEQ